MRKLLLPALIVAAALAGCNTDTPPPLTGNLTDAHGANAGSFRGPDNAATNPGDTVATNHVAPANSQDAPQ